MDKPVNIFEAMYLLFVVEIHVLKIVDIRYTQSVPIRNGPIRHTSEIFGFFKKRLVKF